MERAKIEKCGTHRRLRSEISVKYTRLADELSSSAAASSGSVLSENSIPPQLAL